MNKFKHEYKKVKMFYMQKIWQSSVYWFTKFKAENKIKYCRIHVSTKLVYNLEWVSSTNKHSIIICVSLKNSSTNYDEVTWPALHGHGSLY